MVILNNRKSHFIIRFANHTIWRKKKWDGAWQLETLFLVWRVGGARNTVAGTPRPVSHGCVVRLTSRANNAAFHGKKREWTNQEILRLRSAALRCTRRRRGSGKRERAPRPLPLAISERSLFCILNELAKKTTIHKNSIYLIFYSSFVSKGCH